MSISAYYPFDGSADAAFRLRGLTTKEREALRLRYWGSPEGGPLTFAAVGRRMGVNRQRAGALVATGLYRVQLRWTLVRRDLRRDIVPRLSVQAWSDLDEFESLLP